MPRKMPAREARANFGDLLGVVHYTKEPVIIVRRGRPFAVVISPEDFETLRAQRAQQWGLARSGIALQTWILASCWQT